MPVIVTPTTNQIIYFGASLKHPLTAELGEMALCDECHVIGFTDQMFDAVNRHDLTTRKRICFDCEIEEAQSFEVQVH